MDDLALDHETIDRQIGESHHAAPAEPWLARRALTIGASDVPACLIAYGGETREGRRYHAESARIVSTRHGEMPAFVAVKCGLRKGKKRSSAMAAGSRREVALLRAAEPQIGATVSLATDAPREWYPLIDRYCPALSCTPDAWARDWLGELVAVEAKCTRDHPRELPWWFEAQVQAQIAVMSAASGLLVCGRGWAVSDAVSSTPIVWEIEKSDAWIELIRMCAINAAERIRAIKEAMSNGE